MPAESTSGVEGEPRRLQVVGSVIFWDNEVLIGQRLPSSPVEPCKLEFIGGKYDEMLDMSPEAALVREMQEEMAMDVRVVGEYARNSHDYMLADGRTLSIELVCYRCEPASYSFEARQVHNAWWMPRASLPVERFAAADIPIAEQVIAEVRSIGEE
jgi:8-oxo-dGTP pyrophosphatase MutT (NUDIX family)